MRLNGLGVSGLGFGVWGLEFGVWGGNFRNWDLKSGGGGVTPYDVRADNAGKHFAAAAAAAAAAACNLQHLLLALEF